MAESDPLEAWAVTTFNVVAFGLVGVVAGHAGGVLDDALPGFGTLPGLATVGYLWLLVAVATRWALAGGGLTRLDADGVWPLLARGTAAGAGVGAAFVGGAALAGGVVSLLAGGVPLGSLALVVLFAGVGGAVGGSVVGAAFVLVDVALYLASAPVRPPGD